MPNDRYQRQILGDAPVTFNDLEFNPLLVRDYPDYARAKQAMELMQSSLSPQLARLSWCECLWALDRECEKQTGKIGDFLVSTMIVMARS